MRVRTGWLPAIVVALIALGWDAALAGPNTSSRINPALMALHAEHAAHAAQQSGIPFASSNPLARVVDERVVIDAVADGDVPALRAALASLGMRNVATSGRVVSGDLPIAAIPALDATAGLRFARASYAARSVGAVTSQGDQAMRADVGRATFGVTGAGVQVGVLSDSFDCRRGAAADIASGDLSPVTVLQEISGCADATDEGRAMLQIVHDVAPGAGLSFASAFNGQASFANNIVALKANGARVIVDDVFYFTEPMFQDGIIAQAVDMVVGQGTAYFSSAGNQARQSYESAFRAGSVFADGAFPSVGVQAPHFRGGTAHNFAPTGLPDVMQRITIPGFASLTLILQWDSPFFSVSGGSGSPNDVDIYVLNAAGTQVVGGTASTDTGNDAVEVFNFRNPGATADFNLMIVNFAGPVPGFIKYVNVGSSSITTREFNTASSTLFGHANAQGAEAVGAAAWFNTPAFGVSPPQLEAFSSAGPTPILFDIAGNRFASPVIRQKPEIVAPDGVNTTFFGSDIPQDPDTFPNFFGTSAAAPHAAAVAALLLERQPALAPSVIYSALEHTAIDMGPPGFDSDSGFGLIQADAALGMVSSLMPLAAAVLPSSRSVMVGTAATAFATAINAGPSPAIGVEISLATPLLASFSYQATDPLTNQPTGMPNTPVDIPAGGFQTYVISLTPSAAFGATEVQLAFGGANTRPVPPLPGINTLLLSASASPVPDIIALATTPTGDLITNIPGPTGTGVFAVATSNAGAGGSITVSTDLGGAVLPLIVTLCQTNPMAMAACLAPPASQVTTTINAGATPTFSFFVRGTGNVPFDPAKNRIFVRFKDAALVTRGSTSVAVRTAP